tara:strand:+ start:314 stop:1057 length:744 start_codon:yes stop_codon:yes gene_type:complete
MNLFESNLVKVKAIFALNFLLSVGYISTVGITLNEFAVCFIIFFLMNCLGITVTFHRYYSHYAFEFKHKYLEYFCALLGMLSCSGSALGWAGIHRNHHKYSDADKDPHQAQRGVVAMISIDYFYNPSSKMMIDLLKNRFILLTHQYFFIPAFVYCIWLYWLFDARGLVIGFAIPSFITMFSQGFTNFINHKNTNDYSPVNVWWMNFFSFGDGWHKNHHENPRSYTSSTKWYEIDICGILIKYVLRKT